MKSVNVHTVCYLLTAALKFSDRRMIIRDSFMVIQYYRSKKSYKKKGCLFGLWTISFETNGSWGNVKSVTWNSNQAMRLQGPWWWKSPKALHHHSSHHKAKQGIYRNLIRGKDWQALIKLNSSSAKFSQTLLTPIIHLGSVSDCHSPCPWGQEAPPRGSDCGQSHQALSSTQGIAKTNSCFAKSLNLTEWVKSRVTISGEWNII